MSSRRLAVLLATCGGCGHAPVAPGTAGSLAAMAVAYVLLQVLTFPPWSLALLAAVLFWPASWAASEAAKHFGREDPGEVVIDEFIGQWLALSVIDAAVWIDWLLAFLLFRAFDIVKPFPLRRLERLPAGYGVVADDVGAGFCAMIILSGWQWLARG